MSAPSNRLANALPPLGQRVKTISLLRFLHDSALWQQVRTQLHHGASRQDVTQRIFFADQGMFRSGDSYQRMNRASGLRLLSHAVLVYNTLRIARDLEDAKAQGQECTPEAVAHMSPLAYRHVIVSRPGRVEDLEASAADGRPPGIPAHAAGTRDWESRRVHGVGCCRISTRERKPHVVPSAVGAAGGGGRMS